MGGMTTVAALAAPHPSASEPPSPGVEGSYRLVCLDGFVWLLNAL
jgi:hypothetical protein